jgi:DNA-binding transcriptional regulator YhcF (GntR family)
MNPSFVLPEITLDRSQPHSLRHQIHSQTAAAIRLGALPHGTRLPSSRLLAKLLHVSRNTVVEAYERLLEDGLITTKAGSCIQVEHSRSSSVPNFSNLRKTARAAHYPARTIQLADPDGTTLYLNATR